MQVFPLLVLSGQIVFDHVVSVRVAVEKLLPVKSELVKSEFVKSALVSLRTALMCTVYNSNVIGVYAPVTVNFYRLVCSGVAVVENDVWHEYGCRIVAVNLI